MDHPGARQYGDGGPSRTESPDSTSSDLTKPRRRPVPRKGHTKSRKGCYNCKKRKIKCQENIPECHHCTKAGLVCVYPVTEKALWIPVPQPPLQTTPTQFTMQDMRFFHHFLRGAYPHLPVNGEEIWKNKVAPISHTYDFLMHALLAVAASDLSLVAREDHSSAALSHRVRAITSLNRSLSQPCRDATESDARFATVMALAFHSTHMADGMRDFLTMIRGCTVVSTSAMLNFADSAFATFSAELHILAMRKLIKPDHAVPLLDSNLRDALESARNLQPLVRTPFERKYLSTLESVLQSAEVSLMDAYGTLIELYTFPAEISHEIFLSFVDPGNTTGQLLLAHFIAIDFLLNPILRLDPPHQPMALTNTIPAGWVVNIHERLPDSLKPFSRWPADYSRAWKRAMDMKHGQEIELIGV